MILYGGASDALYRYYLELENQKDLLREHHKQEKNSCFLLVSLI